MVCKIGPIYTMTHHDGREMDRVKEGMDGWGFFLTKYLEIFTRSLIHSL
jgi:hypothetical protein